MLEHKRITNRFLPVLWVVFGLLSLDVFAGTAPGSPEDVSYAHKLWGQLKQAKLVGPHSKPLKPFFGGAKPHGMILEVAHQNISIGNHTGFVVVKRNYNGKDVSVKNVKKDRKKYLSSITIMYQREKGYDPKNLNWFWAKYLPDGTLASKKTPQGHLTLAGRLIEGKDGSQNRGCLFCHSSAGGGDYIFYPQIKLPGYRYP